MDGNVFDVAGLLIDWKAVIGLTWLDLGNGWRNLFLLSCILQAGALGVAFSVHRWFTKESRLACFFTGAALTPLVQYLWTLVLALVWPTAPRLIYIGVLPALAGLYLLQLALRHIKKAPALLSQTLSFAKRLCSFDKPALVSLCFALAMLILLAPVCVRLCGSMNNANAGDAGEYMGLAVHYCEDRDLGYLLEKEETQGHFRANNHFPSLELYMAYGLMHTPEAYGYPYDKPMLAGVGLLTFYMVLAFGALLLALCRERRRWVLLGLLLFNLVPNLFYSVNGAPRDIWRILALLIAALFFGGLEPLGSWKSYVGKLAAAFILCFAVMSAHVVCFVVLPFIVVAWVLSRWMDGLASLEKRSGRTLLSSVGIALSGAAGTLVAFSGNLWCFLKWGQMSPWRLMTTYTTAPWYDMYMVGEYKLEETTTTLNFWKAKYDIVMAYATPIGLWGMRLALVGLICGIAYISWRRHSQRRLLYPGGTLTLQGTPMGVRTVSALLYASLLVLCTLAPMTGLLDTKLYSFSGSFTALQRYTLQWFVLTAVMIPAALSALEGFWPIVNSWLGPKWGKLARQVPAFLCAVLCLFAFVKGTDQTGYTNSFYRYSRDVMESEDTLLDNGFLQRNGLLMLADRYTQPDQKILLTRMGYQYPIKAKGYILTSNPVVPLMDLSLSQVPAALAEMNVAFLATEPKFWDERYFAKSTLSEYLSTLPPEQVFQDDTMRLYVLDTVLAAKLTQALESAPSL